MPYYLVQAGYTAEAWRTQTGSPQNIIERLKPTVDNLGGTIENIFYAFGEYDVVAIVQFPDNASAAAFSVAASSGGAVTTIRTTPLMTVEEGMEMMRKAGGAGYRPPGG